MFINNYYYLCPRSEFLIYFRCFLKPIKAFVFPHFKLGLEVNLTMFTDHGINYTWPRETEILELNN